MTQPRPKTTKINAQTLRQTLDTLITQRETWERDDFTKANTNLYALLGRCLDLYLAIEAERSLRAHLNSYLENKGLRTKGSASLQLRIVRAVFVTRNAAGTFEARLHGYAKVIKVTADNNCTGKDIAAFITSNNGIDAIRRKNWGAGEKTPSFSPQQARDLAHKELSKPTYKKLFKDFKLPTQLEPAADKEFSVALVRRDSKGMGSIVFGTNKESAINAVLTIAGRELNNEAGTKKIEQDSAEKLEQHLKGVEAFAEAIATA